MDVHPGQIRLAVSPGHAQELPSIAFIEAGVVG